MAKKTVFVQPLIYTIGYQGLTPGQFIGLLRAHGVDLLIDIRSKPFSRMKGFKSNHVQRRLLCRLKQEI